MARSSRSRLAPKADPNAKMIVTSMAIRRTCSGRPTKLTADDWPRNTVLAQRYDEIIEAATDALRKGNTHRTAAARAKVPLATFVDWLSRGEGHDDKPPTEPYKSFAEAVRAAEAESEAFRVERVIASEDWRAHAWHLAHRNPQDWGNQSLANPNAGAGNGPTSLLLTVVAPGGGRLAGTKTDRLIDGEAFESGELIRLTAPEGNDGD